MNMEKLIILGSSGSIGTQALDVAKRYSIPVDAVSVNTSVKALDEQVRDFSPKYAVVASEDAYKEAKILLADTSVKLFCGKEGIAEVLSRSDADTVLNALVGEAGLRPTVWTLENGKRLALANKESLVCAGDIVMKLAAAKGVEILPVDSEHCAIHQCLRAGARDEAKELILTASGGPFFGYSEEALQTVTPEDTLKHPTWKMGQKITVDSATLMNKGFELIEAAHLFGFDMDDISAVVHRESIIHSMVRFADNSVIAQMGNPDMRSCIAYALFYPERRFTGGAPLDLVSLGKMTFFEPDTKTFPLLSLAKEVHKAGGLLPAVLNAANEEAVYAFLAKKIGFADIGYIVSDFVHSYENKAAPTLDEIENASQTVRRKIRERLAQKEQ